MNLLLLGSSACLVVGGLLLVYGLTAPRRPPLALRLALLEGAASGGARFGEPDWLTWIGNHYARELRQAGEEETPRRLLLDKLVLALAATVVPTLPYAAATGHAPQPVVLGLLAVGGSFLPDLLLRERARRRREAIFLDLPEAIAILTLALGAGESLHHALELAAREVEGPLGAELERALTLARRDRDLDERQALVLVAREAGEPGFARFAELLAVKESPYLDFLRQQARETRAEQARYLERAADRAYLSMHAPLAPLLAVLVLLIAYGFLRFLAHTV
jgi:hypothetical protein